MKKKKDNKNILLGIFGVVTVILVILIVLFVNNLSSVEALNSDLLDSEGCIKVSENLDIDKEYSDLITSSVVYDGGFTRCEKAEKLYEYSRERYLAVLESNGDFKYAVHWGKRMRFAKTYLEENCPDLGR